MKAQGNITQGKTIERHINEGTLNPYMVVRFYGPSTPERFVGKDVYVTGWYNTGSGLTFTVRTSNGASDVCPRHYEDKVGIYVDQADAKADFEAAK